ncbi:recombinase family protein, partial [Gaetbulibacter aestuarii]
SPSGKFQQNLFFMFSQFDNELRKDKTITAMSDLIRKGYWLWTPPLGYINKKKYHKAVDWEIVIDNKGKLLKKAFKWKVQGTYSNVEIVRKLNLAGMKINEKRLHEIFKNPFYCGILISNMLPGEINLGKHEPLVSKENFLKINSSDSPHPKTHKSDDVNLPLKRLMYCNSCNTPLTGFLVKRKGLYYYKCRNKGCSCTKSAKQLHKAFRNTLDCYQIDSKYKDIIKDVMIYVYYDITKELRENEKNVKKQITETKSKLDAIEERFATGEITQDIYQKFKPKYDKELMALESNLVDSSISSSNLKIAIEKALEMSSNLNEIWTSGDLIQKKKIQRLVFPSGLGYDKQNNKVQTPRVNSLFSLIPSISKDLKEIKNGEPINFDKFSARVNQIGFKLLYGFNKVI